MQCPTNSLSTLGSPRSDLSLVHEFNQRVWSLQIPRMQSGRLLTWLLLRLKCFNDDKLLKSLGKSSLERSHFTRLKLTRNLGKEVHETFRVLLCFNTQNQRNDCHDSISEVGASNRFIVIPSAWKTFKDSILLNSVGSSPRLEQPDIRSVSSKLSIAMFCGSFLRFLQSFRFKKTSRCRCPIDSWSSTKLGQSFKLNLSRFGSNEKSGVFTRPMGMTKIEDF